MTDNKCPQCGSVLPDETKFCTACGNVISAKGETKGSGLFLILFLIVVIIGGGYGIYKYMDKPQDTSTHPPIPGMSGEGMPTFDEMISNLPDDYNELVNLGHFYMDREFYLIAIECYSRTLGMDSSNPDIFTDLGACYHAADMPTKAIETLGKALSIDPEHKIACFNIGVVYKNMGLSDSTKEYWNRFLELEPNSQIADTLRLILNNL